MSAPASVESFEDRMAREAAEKRARLAQRRVLVAEIAKHLGAPWSLKPERENQSWDLSVSLVGEGGREISLGSQRYGDNAGGRLGVHGTSLRQQGAGYSHYGITWPTITVAESRGAEAIAKEITRRLLPEYEKAWNEASGRAQRAQDYDDETTAGAEKLAEILGGKVGDRNRSTGSEGRVWVPGGCPEVKVSGNNATLTFGVTVEKAAALARAWLEIRGKGGDDA
jgi:hypothetical protein